MILLSLSTPHVALDVVVAPASIPRAPQSGVFLAKRSPTSSARPAAPCATFWPGAAAGTLRTSQVLTVAADELDWLYENTDDETDPTCVQARAAIEGWLAELSPEHQQAIAFHHDPTPWPEEIPGHEDDSFALILHQLRPSTPRALRANTPHELQLRARRRVEIRIEREGSRSLRRLVRQGRWLYEEAVREYARTRGRVASVLPQASSAFASSLPDEEVPSCS